MKKLAILGSTGSIGTQTLNIVDRYPNEYQVVALAVNSDIEGLARQINKYNPSDICVSSGISTKDSTFAKVNVVSSIEDIAKYSDYDILVVAVTGIYGLSPTLRAIERGKIVALANKETLVAGGAIVKKALTHNPQAKLLPLDSEHSAIWQSISANNHKDINKLILTASGGPFRAYTAEQLKQVKLEDALHHPTWNMGAKVTIDCATLMNKGLELIEAMWLFDMPEDKIDIVIHRESIIHSMVEYNDGAVIAEMSNPSMILPIQYALTYPTRVSTGIKPLDFADIGQLHFEKPDYDRFPCLRLARDVAKQGGSAPIVMNASDTVAVKKFCAREIGYGDIYSIVDNAVNKFSNAIAQDEQSILALDKEVSDYVTQYRR